MAAGDRASGDTPPQPGHIPETVSSSYARAVGQGWVVEGMMQMQKALGELSAHVDGARSVLDDHRRDVKSDFRWTWSGLAAAAVLLVGALIFAYFRLEDRQVALGTSLARVETKLDDLLQRLPPPPAPRR